LEGGNPFILDQIECNCLEPKIYSPGKNLNENVCQNQVRKVLKHSISLAAYIRLLKGVDKAGDDVSSLFYQQTKI
jgi:hypothetical protein